MDIQVERKEGGGGGAKIRHRNWCAKYAKWKMGFMIYLDATLILIERNTSTRWAKSACFQELANCNLKKLNFIHAKIRKYVNYSVLNSYFQRSGSVSFGMDPDADPDLEFVPLTHGSRCRSGCGSVLKSSVTFRMPKTFFFSYFLCFNKEI